LVSSSCCCGDKMESKHVEYSQHPIGSSHTSSSSSSSSA
jgi:hypothetical protein